MKLAILCFAWQFAAIAPTPPKFTDIASKAGLNDVIVSGGMPKRFVLEVNGSGACWLDFDRDGFQDLYLVNGATLAQMQGKAPRNVTNHLYRNNQKGGFINVTAKASSRVKSKKARSSSAISTTRSKGRNASPSE